MSFAPKIAVVVEVEKTSVRTFSITSPPTTKAVLPSTAFCSKVWRSTSTISRSAAAPDRGGTSVSSYDNVGERMTTSKNGRHIYVHMWNLGHVSVPKMNQWQTSVPESYQSITNEWDVTVIPYILLRTALARIASYPLVYFKSSFKNKTRIYGVLAEDLSVRWLHLFFHLVCCSSPLREGALHDP